MFQAGLKEFFRIVVRKAGAVGFFFLERVSQPLGGGIYRGRSGRI